jgi:polyisoprenoid-binding protein YceI
MGFLNRSKTSSTAVIEPDFDAGTAAVEDIAGDYTLDVSHSRLGFSARVSLTIDASSIDTGSADRDGHLRSGDFFDADAHKQLTFVSTNVARDGDEWTITGDLTIKGVTKPVTIVFEETGSARDPFGNLRVGFEGSTSINRKDWGLTWNAALETGGVLVSEKIKLDRLTRNHADPSLIDDGSAPFRGA